MAKEKDKFRIMDVLGVEGLYVDDRSLIFRTSAFFSDTDFNLYDFRGGKNDDPGEIATVEDKAVIVNYCGTFLTRGKLEFPKEQNYISLSDDDWGFTDGEMTIDEYLS